MYREMLRSGFRSLSKKKAGQFKNIYQADPHNIKNKNLKWVETHLDSLKDCRSKLGLPNGRCHNFLLFSQNTNCVKHHRMPGIASYCSSGTDEYLRGVGKDVYGVDNYLARPVGDDSFEYVYCTDEMMKKFAERQHEMFEDYKPLEPYTEDEEEDEDVWEEEWADREKAVVDRSDDDATELLAANIRLSERENIANPNDAKILKYWGLNLLEMAYFYYMDDNNNKRVLLLEAIDKLEKSLELNPEDIRTKLELVCAQLRLRIPKRDGDEEYVRLVKEYKTLYEALKTAAAEEAMDRKAMWERVGGKF